jgi:hypothetical protein
MAINYGPLSVKIDEGLEGSVRTGNVAISVDFLTSKISLDVYTNTGPIESGYSFEYQPTPAAAVSAFIIANPIVNITKFVLSIGF